MRSERDGRVILIGFDAGILRSVDYFIEDLPFFKRLIREGSSCEARPSIPADTPTNWTTIATGAFSATHGIFGFNNDVGLMKGRRPAVELAETFGSNQNRAEYIWETAEREGKKCILLHYPVAWPPTVKNSIVAGTCGVSSSLWKVAGPAIYSTCGRGTEKIEVKKVDSETSQTGNFEQPVMEGEFPIVCGKNLHWTAFGQVAKEDKRDEVPGESDFIIYPSQKPLPETRVTQNKGELIYRLQVLDSKGAGYDKARIYKKRCDKDPLVELTPGQWVGPVYDTLTTESGETEVFYYLKLHELSRDGTMIRICRSYISLVHGYTYPEEISIKLKEEDCPLQGNLENATTVMKNQFYFNEGWEDIYIIPEMCELQVNKIADAAKYLLNNYEWDISFIQVHIPDGLNHTLGAYLHPDAQKYTSRVDIERALCVFRETYKTMDRMLGRIWQECAGSQDTIAVVSDHGSVGSWRYACIQGYLVAGGFMKLKSVDSPVFGQRYVVDMEKSKVFMSEHLHINVKGKYHPGTVEPEDFLKVRDELIEYLKDFTDPDNGEKVLSHVLKREEAGYLGINCDYVGDVVYFLRPGYYPSVIKINFFVPDEYKKIMSGENITTKPGATHPYHPDIPLGIMSTNAMFFIAGPGIRKNYRKEESIHLADVAPTIAHLAGITKPADADGELIRDFLEDNNS